MQVVNLLAVGIGGVIGTLFRYWLNIQTLEVEFPMGTLLENLAGSFLLGSFTGWFIYNQTREWIRLGLGVGFCGGFTTMSTLAADTFFLYEDSVVLPIIYVVISLLGGVLLAFSGIWLGEKWGMMRSKRHVKGGDNQ